MSTPQNPHTRQEIVGFTYAMGAYLWWGLVPLYFSAIAHISVWEILAHRMLWSFPILVLIVLLRKHWSQIRSALASRRVVALLLLSTVCIATNWLLYIWAVAHHRVTEASLGYYLNPLINIALGMIVLRERMRSLQWLALLLAGAGVVWYTISLDELPWIAITLAVTFGLYALIRKVIHINAFDGLFIEIALLLVPSIVFLIVVESSSGTAMLAGNPRDTMLLLVAGIVTVTPLLWFTEGARRLRLSTMGFMQYIAPSIQLLLAIFAFREPFTTPHAIAFGCIWASLSIYTVDAVVTLRRKRRLRLSMEVVEDL
ncbi:MAG: EamA family transporter RarD [Phycisphaerales bacterium JB043]